MSMIPQEEAQDFLNAMVAQRDATITWACQEFAKYRREIAALKAEIETLKAEAAKPKPNGAAIPAEQSQGATP